MVDSFNLVSRASQSPLSVPLFASSPPPASLLPPTFDPPVDDATAEADTNCGWVVGGMDDCSGFIEGNQWRSTISRRFYTSKAMNRLEELSMELRKCCMTKSIRYLLKNMGMNKPID
jgi:hypothetical protein